MPRAARFRIAAIDELFRQLRYAPSETRERLMDAAEALLNEIDAERTYPVDFIVYRVTGYRPDRTDETMLVGAALVPELINLVQRLSERLELEPVRGESRARPLKDVAASLKVSVKTLRRYHREGLVFHFVRFGGPQPILACYDHALDRFLQRHGARVNRAARFTRIDARDEAAILDTARTLYAEQALSLNEVARQLADRYGRAHETVRNLLQRHDRRGPEPIFHEHGPLQPRDQRLAYRAWRRGIAMSTIARRLEKTPATVRRAVQRERGHLLASLTVQYIELPTFALDDAASIILSRPEVTSGLDDLLPTEDALALIEASRNAQPLDENVEASIVAAMHFLHRRAATSIAALPAWPGAGALDIIETDLRWATMLRRRLASAGLPAALRVMEQHLGRTLPTLPADQIRARLRRGVQIVSDIAVTLDPSRHQRLDRRVRLAASKSLARATVPEAAPTRAAARHAAGAIPISTLFDGLAPWETMLELPRSWRAHVAALGDGAARELLTQRYGFDGRAPQTIAAMAKLKNVTDSATARALGKAEASLRTTVRRSIND